MRASKDGSLWTKFGANQPLTGSFKVLSDGSGWNRTIQGIGTASQKITRTGDSIVIAGEKGDVRCEPN